jgi:uncharacterized protein YqhQ
VVMKLIRAGVIQALRKGVIPASLSMAARFYYGGQAVMEGVMMRGRTSAAVVGRRPDDSLYLHEEPLNARIYKNRVLRLPFLRGMLLLWDTLILGTRMMTFSANVATGALDPGVFSLSSVGIATSHAEAPPVVDTPEEAASPRPPVQDEKPAPIGGATLALSLLVSLSLAIAVFFVGPLLVASMLNRQLGRGWLSLGFEGLLRLALLVGYLVLIGRVPDIERVFGYHGAEHKAINTMEKGEPLDVAHVRLASRVHTRCGTGFLLLVMVLSIFVFALVGSPSLLLRIVSRIVLVPVVAGIAYELMRAGAANYRFRVVRWLLAPGLALQGLTTREPDDSMIECAIAALQCVMLRDKLGTN